MSLRTLNFRKPDHNHCAALKEQASLHTQFMRFNSMFMETLILKVTMVDSSFSFFKLILWSPWSEVRVVRARRVGTSIRKRLFVEEVPQLYDDLRPEQLYII